MGSAADITAHSATSDEDAFMVRYALNDGPESLVFVPADQTFVNIPLLLAVTPLAGRLTVYEITTSDTLRVNDGSCASTDVCPYLTTADGGTGAAIAIKAGGSSVYDPLSAATGGGTYSFTVAANGNVDSFSAATIDLMKSSSESHAHFPQPALYCNTFRLPQPARLAVLATPLFLPSRPRRAMRGTLPLTESPCSTLPSVMPVSLIAGMPKTSITLTITAASVNIAVAITTTSAPQLTAIASAVAPSLVSNTAATNLLGGASIVTVTAIVQGGTVNQAPQVDSSAGAAAANDSDGDDSVPTWGLAVIVIVGVLAICLCVMMYIMCSKEKQGKPIFTTVVKPAA